MTTTTAGMEARPSETILLKTDRLGRVRMPEAKREALLDRFESSGMSGPCFAKWAGINYQTFASWRQKRVRQGGESSRIGWVEAELEQATSEGCSSGPLTIHLPGGARMEVGGIGQVPLAVEVLRHLEARC
jgi:hypothetical protein